MEKWWRLLFFGGIFNSLLFYFIWQLNIDDYPWLIALQLVIPILVWELLLVTTFISEDFFGLEEFLGDFVTPMSRHSFAGRPIRSSGDFSTSALHQEESWPEIIQLD